MSYPAEPHWTDVDQYFANTLLPTDPVLQASLAANAAAGMPAHDVSPLQGQFLSLMLQAMGAKRVLEIGTLGGYSTIWMARALPADGQVVTLEIDASRAAVARQNFERAGVQDRITLLEGPAAESMRHLAERREAGDGEPFDFIFVDADKPSNPVYLALALRLSRPGTVIIGDNVVRDGAVADAHSTDANVQGVRRFLDMLAAEPRVQATALQTVGCKGYDGFAMAVVR
jgi:predicted O-methyltransferase YrrM